MGTIDYSEPIAWLLFRTLKFDYEDAKANIKVMNKRSFKGHVPEALFSFPMSVTVSEAFLHECFYNIHSEVRFRKKMKPSLSLKKVLKNGI